MELQHQYSRLVSDESHKTQASQLIGNTTRSLSDLEMANRPTSVKAEWVVHSSEGQKFFFNNIFIAFSHTDISET